MESIICQTKAVKMMLKILSISIIFRDVPHRFIIFRKATMVFMGGYMLPAARDAVLIEIRQTMFALASRRTHEMVQHSSSHVSSLMQSFHSCPPCQSTRHHHAPRSPPARPQEVMSQAHR